MSRDFPEHGDAVAGNLFGVLVTYAAIGDRSIFVPALDRIPPVLILPEGVSQERAAELAAEALALEGEATA